MAACKRASFGPGHLRIDVAVDDIVIDAACAAHREGTDGKKDQQPRDASEIYKLVSVDGEGRGIVGACGESNRPPAGPHQQPCADGAVCTDEP